MKGGEKKENLSMLFTEIGERNNGDDWGEA
jgi:hypothetical protein